MVAKLRTRTCQWPRFSRYELIENRIAPAPGARLKWYDPWREYIAAKTGGTQPPYVTLLTLVDRMRQELIETGFDFESGEPPKLSESLCKLLIEWTDRWGLLGIFHQCVVLTEDLVGNNIWTRSGGRWCRSYRFDSLSNPRPPVCLVHLSPTSADLHQMDARESLTNLLGANPSEIAAPDSEEFFAGYSEPLAQWILYAFDFTEAINFKNADGLNAIAGAAGRERRFTRQGTKSEIVFPSLISLFAETAWQDFETGNRIGTCGNCGDRFATDREWTKFCGRDCATKERQRRFLERNPDYYRVQAKKGRKAK